MFIYTGYFQNLTERYIKAQLVFSIVKTFQFTKFMTLQKYTLEQTRL